MFGIGTAPMTLRQKVTSNPANNAHLTTVPGVWRQWDGRVVPWTPYWNAANNEPNGARLENCGAVSFGPGELAGKWRSHFCSTPQYYICEKWFNKSSTQKRRQTLNVIMVLTRQKFHPGKWLDFTTSFLFTFDQKALLKAKSASILGFSVFFNTLQVLIWAWDGIFQKFTSFLAVETMWNLLLQLLRSIFNCV